MATKKIEQEIKKTEKENKKEETIKILIPIDKLNPQDKEIIVGINEKYAKIVRGKETDVTRPVFEQLRNAGLV